MSFIQIESGQKHVCNARCNDELHTDIAFASVECSVLDVMRVAKIIGMFVSPVAVDYVIPEAARTIFRERGLVPWAYMVHWKR